jgi:hypothetical protein
MISGSYKVIDVRDPEHQEIVYQVGGPHQSRNYFCPEN